MFNKDILKKFDAIIASEYEDPAMVNVEYNEEARPVNNSLTSNNDKGNILMLRNTEQKILFCCELQGQLSDGAWENARPADHWQFWCDIKWDQIGISNKIGVYSSRGTERMKKNDYAFTAPRILKIIGSRMIFMVKCYHVLGDKIIPFIKSYKRLPESVEDYEDMIYRASTNSNTSAWAKEKIEEFNAIGINKDTIYDIDHDSYNRLDLLTDLRDIKTAFLTKLF